MKNSAPKPTNTFEYFQVKEFDKVMKAVKFIYISSFSLFGAGTTMMVGNIVHKSTVMAKIKKILLNDYIQKAQFTNLDFRDFFQVLAIHKNSNNTTFIYNDPPYLSLRVERYNTPKWTQKDFDNLLDINLKTGYKFAISEFDNPYVLNAAKRHNLRVIEVCKRRNVKTISTEILIVNY